VKGKRGIPAATSRRIRTHRPFPIIDRSKEKRGKKKKKETCTRDLTIAYTRTLNMQNVYRIRV